MFGYKLMLAQITFVHFFIYTIHKSISLMVKPVQSSVPFTKTDFKHLQQFTSSRPQGSDGEE